MSRTVRNKLATFFVAVSFCVTIYAWMDARYETITILRQREETEDAILGLLQSDNYGMVIADEEGKIILWSNALERITGWSSSDRVGKLIKEIIPPRLEDGVGNKLVDKHDSKYSEATRDPESHDQLVTVVCPITTKSGGEHLVRISSRVVRGRHGTVYVVANIDLEKEIIEMEVSKLN